MGESLSIVADEMQNREQVQDDQARGLATKAAFLFTAGTTTVAAVGTYIGFVLDEVSLDFGAILIALFLSGLAYLGLGFCFVNAYRVRDFQRAPEPEELLKYRHMPSENALEDIADARRCAIETNDQILEVQGDWVNRELYSVVCIFIGVAVALVSLSSS